MYVGGLKLPAESKTTYVVSLIFQELVCQVIEVIWKKTVLVQLHGRLETALSLLHILRALIS